MVVRSAWLTNRGDSAGGQSRTDTRLAPTGTMTPAGAMTSAAGVIPGSADGQSVLGGLAVTGAGMSATVGAGRAVIQGAEGAGAYPVVVTEPETVTFTDGDANNPRIDLVVLRVFDQAHDDSGQTLAAVEIITGTPAPTPTPPPVPEAALLLAEVTVGAGASAGSGGIDWDSALVDRREAVVAAGGIQPTRGVLPVGAYPGQYCDDGTGLCRFDGTHWQPVTADTGWVNLPLPTGFTRYSNNAYPFQIRRLGNQVHVRGRINRTAGPIPSGDFSLPGLTLPQQFRPSQSATSYLEIFMVCGTNSANPSGLIRGQVTGDGRIVINFPAAFSSWIGFGCTWWAD